MEQSGLLILLIGYFFIGFVCLFFGVKKIKSTVSDNLLLLQWIGHTVLLCWHSYSLKRPPVATMQESYIFVAWVVALLVLLVKKRRDLIPFAKNKFINLTRRQHKFLSLEKATIAIRQGASEDQKFVAKPTQLNMNLFFANDITSIGSFAAAFLILLALTISSSQAPLAPVLNAPLWLSIHVLVIVASYGAFLVAAIFSHLYLWTGNLHWYKEVFQCHFIGAGLLTVGTILGGMWASRTWGSFWSWDVKESWAFITICIYLAALHVESLKLAKPRTISLISSVGFLAVSFTWYGINFVIKKGMHTYGFGQGNVLFYLFAVIADVLLLLFMTVRAARFSR